jgi:hypothetical protein
MVDRAGERTGIQWPTLSRANIKRRHLTKGQQGMAVAMACPATGQTQREAAQVTSVSKTAIGKAAIILEHLPDLAKEVLRGATTLEVAYFGRRRGSRRRQ